MIDGIKLYARIDDFDSWQASSDLEFKTDLNIETGEIGSTLQLADGGIKEVFEFKCKFGSYSLTLKRVSIMKSEAALSKVAHLIIRGSLHKNYHKGFNSPDFTFSQLLDEISWLSKKVKISPENLILKNLEFGLNIEVDFPVFDFLSRNLVIYKFHQFNRYAPDQTGKSIGFYCPLSQYSLKIYDKAKQYGLKSNILRVELRYKKMAPLKGIRANSLKDLGSTLVLNELFGKLTKAWEHVLLFDISELNEVPKLFVATPEFILNAKNPKYWEKLKQDNGNSYFYHRKKFNNYLASNNNRIHSSISAKMRDKMDGLLFQ